MMTVSQETVNGLILKRVSAFLTNGKWRMSIFHLPVLNTKGRGSRFLVEGQLVRFFMSLKVKKASKLKTFSSLFAVIFPYFI